MKLTCNNNRLTDPFESVKTVPLHLLLSQGLRQFMNKTKVQVRKQTI